MQQVKDKGIFHFNDINIPYISLLKYYMPCFVLLSLHIHVIRVNVLLSKTKLNYLIKLEVKVAVM